MSEKRTEALPPQIKQYGDMYGLRHHFFVKGGMPDPVEQPALPALLPADEKKVRVHYNNLKTHIPEMVDFAKELIAEGMMPGARNIRVRIYTK